LREKEGIIIVSQQKYPWSKFNELLQINSESKERLNSERYYVIFIYNFHGRFEIEIFDVFDV